MSADIDAAVERIATLWPLGLGPLDTIRTELLAAEARGAAAAEARLAALREAIEQASTDEYDPRYGWDQGHQRALLWVLALPAWTATPLAEKEKP